MIETEWVKPDTPAKAAHEARRQLTEAIARLRSAGFEQIRVDQLAAGPVMVEIGYVYGESRLTVHKESGVTDFRLTGYEHDKFDQFLELAI